MPPHLHPRSRATSTLFAGTLLASFAVVAVPHIWPCPRPRQQYNDSEIVIMQDGRVMRRVTKAKKQSVEPSQDTGEAMVVGRDATSTPTPILKPQTKMQKEAELLRQLQDEAAARDEENARRECPVPKPKGALGRLLGFDNGNSSNVAKADTR